jgi:SAM-dependent methyltransferase
LKYRKYFRKTSLKQKGHGETFLKEVLNKKPKSFLEIGVFHGVTARNVCELLYQIHGNDFKYVGLDLFEKSNENKFEVIPSTNFKNPFKKFYHQYIMRQDPYSIEAVSNLLKKFKDQVHLIQGNSNQVLKKMDLSKIDFVFLDGGHEYNTVVNDLNSCIDVLKFNGSILCDDYNLGSAPGVKKAIDEFVNNNNFKCKIICEDRFALIEN